MSSLGSTAPAGDPLPQGSGSARQDPGGTGPRGEVSARELAQRFTVSLITIRRDLMLLERQGKLRRTHGGAYAQTAAVIRVCRAIVDGSDKAALVADHSKFAKSSFARFAALTEFARIITDDQVPDATRQWLSDQSLPVTYAAP